MKKKVVVFFFLNLRYEYFKRGGYDFIIRSDSDVFLTPLFATWLPRHCNDFYVGRGAYSTYFNDKRLRRAAQRLGLDYAGQQNLGSTWYSTPDQIRLVSYLTLFSMVYLAIEEFTQVEREGRLGIALWPEWHYLVILRILAFSIAFLRVLFCSNKFIKYSNRFSVCTDIHLHLIT